MLLARGSKGIEVKVIQEQLNQIGVTCDVDGDFGHGTEKAVKTFQTASGLPADGIVGPNTREKIDEALQQIINAGNQSST